MGNKAMKILDACCGSRMFWFDKEHESAVYMDNRTLETTLCDGRKLIVAPDLIGDFKNISFDDNRLLNAGVKLEGLK